MNDTWQKYLDMATGLTQVTRQRAEQVVRSLVKQGEIAADGVEKNVEELLRRSEDNRKAIVSLVKSETERAINRLGLARNQDVQRLENKVGRLENKVEDGQGAKKAQKKVAKKSSAAKRAAKKAGAKKAGAKKAGAKKAAKRSGAKKAAKRSGAKKAAKRSGAKKAAKRAAKKSS